MTTSTFKCLVLEWMNRWFLNTNRRQLGYLADWFQTGKGKGGGGGGESSLSRYGGTWRTDWAYCSLKPNNFHWNFLLLLLLLLFCFTLCGFFFFCCSKKGLKLNSKKNTECMVVYKLTTPNVRIMSIINDATKQTKGIHQLSAYSYQKMQR